jgi:small subunit ribosomal protein S20
VAARKRARNKSVRSAIKTCIAKAERFILRGEFEPAKQAVAEAIRVLDRAAEKGIIHPNNAARRKSRLVRKFNRASFSTGKVGDER